MQGLSRLGRIAAVAMALVAAGCDDGEETTFEETIDVAANLVPCSALALGLCYLTRTGTSAWMPLTWGIEGFDNYEWGREYRLVVRVTERRFAQPPADGPSVERQYRAVTVDSGTRVPATTPFSLVAVRPGMMLSKDTSGQWAFVGRALACTTPPVCADLELAKAANAPVLLGFDHRNSPAGPLALLSVSPLPP